MTTPRRLLDAESQIPAGLRQLLERADHPAPMTELEAARLERDLRQSTLHGATGRRGILEPRDPSRRRWAVLAAALVFAAGTSAALGWWLGVASGGLPDASPTSQVPAPGHSAEQHDEPAAPSSTREQNLGPPPEADALGMKHSDEPGSRGPESQRSAGVPPGPRASHLPGGAPHGEKAPADDPLARELAYLNDAQIALASDPARALQLTRRHADEFPRGQLAVERELLAIDALMRSGQAEAAKTRAERFRTRFGRGAYEGRLRTLLGER